MLHYYCSWVFICIDASGMKWGEINYLKQWVLSIAGLSQSLIHPKNFNYFHLSVVQVFCFPVGMLAMRCMNQPLFIGVKLEGKLVGTCMHLIKINIINTFLHIFWFFFNKKNNIINPSIIELGAQSGNGSIANVWP